MYNTQPHHSSGGRYNAVPVAGIFCDAEFANRFATCLFVASGSASRGYAPRADSDARTTRRFSWACETFAASQNILCESTCPHPAGAVGGSAGAVLLVILVPVVLYQYWQCCTAAGGDTDGVGGCRVGADGSRGGDTGSRVGMGSRSAVVSALRYEPGDMG